MSKKIIDLLEIIEKDQNTLKKYKELRESFSSPRNMPACTFSISGVTFKLTEVCFAESDKYNTFPSERTIRGMEMIYLGFQRFLNGEIEYRKKAIEHYKQLLIKETNKLIEGTGEQ